MAKLLKLRRGTTSQHGSFTGAEGEVTVDTDKETLVVHAGSTAGGHPVAAEDMANVSSASIAGRLSNDSIATSKIAAGALPSDVTVASANLVDGTIVNADVNASAAIAGTKVTPNFGTQGIDGGALTITGATPTITLTDSDNNPDYKLIVNGGSFLIHDSTNGTDKIKILNNAEIDITPNVDFANGIDVTGTVKALGALHVGSGNDFQVTRSSGNTEVQNYSGTLLIGNASSNSNNIFFRARADENSIECVPDGAVKLYYDGGGVKFETNTGGARVVGDLLVTGTVDGRDVATDGTKLDGIEAGATGDQSNAEIRAAVEAASDSNVFTDADHTKLNGIETAATADQTASEIVSLLSNQNITTSGTITSTGNRMTISGTDPALVLTDNDNNPDYEVRNQNSVFRIYDVQADSSPFVVNGHTDGHIDVNVNADFASGIDVTGNITVSGTVDGRDVASDGTKLDGIEAGATADQTGAEIASALGAQSIYTTGNIGRDANDHIAFTDNTQMDVYINNSNEFRFEADGDFHADGDVIAFSNTTSSDRNLKDNIEVIPNALDKVQALNGVSFTWKRDGTPSAGVIAQEVQGVLPEAVKEVTPVKGGDSHLAVNYNALTSILIESIKELKAEIEELKGGK